MLKYLSCLFPVSFIPCSTVYAYKISIHSINYKLIDKF